jgi:lipoprotein-anchoring transpeptidase ErfK/SrfK
MIVRAATALAAFFIIAGAAGQALAQYYPAPPPPGYYRQLPPVYAEDDDIPAYDPPPGYRRGPPPGYERMVPPAAVEARPVAPPRYGQAGPPMPAPEQDAYIPPPPPGFIYREGPPPGYGHAPVVARPAPEPQPVYPTQQPAYPAQQPAYPAPQPGMQAVAPQPQEPPIEDSFRPPMPIGPSQASPAPGQLAPGPGAPRPQEVTGAVRDPRMAALGPDYQPETGPRKELPAQFRRTLVDYRTKEPVGTIIIDTQSTYLYLVQPGGKAMRYGVGVGREGFTWNGVEKVTKMAEWPDWNPPPEMIERQPYLPRFMAGGETNPLGARALYLGKTIYRIHGTNQPSTIGTFVSSGCIRLTNEDIQDLYTRVKVGTRVVVLPGGKPPATAQAYPQQQQQQQQQQPGAYPQGGAPALPPPVAVR